MSNWKANHQHSLPDESAFPAGTEAWVMKRGMSIEGLSRISLEAWTGQQVHRWVPFLRRTARKHGYVVERIHGVDIGEGPGRYSVFWLRGPGAMTDSPNSRVFK
jgi:hypothetical protein